MDITIDGMHCGACVKRVRMALEKLPGAVVEDVAIGKARVSGVESAAVVAALEKAGYPARVEAT
jgi:copper chaperone CopZ